MTVTLAIIGGTIVILGAAAKIPPAAAAFLRAWIPLIAAFHDLRDAIRRHHGDEVSNAELSGHDSPGSGLVRRGDDASDE